MGLKELKKTLTKELILSKDIFIVAHNNIDLDAFSSMAGFSLLVKKYRKKAYLIIDDKDIEGATKQAMSKISTRVNIINAKDAEKLVTNRTLLVVLDTNKLSRISVKDIIKSFKNVIVIDHHSKSGDTIKDSVLYIDEKATSTCEIVTSLLYKYRVKVPRTFATAMLGGIVLDTNNFMYKMTRKAFFYCHYLSTKGADVDEAQRYFKQDLEEYIDRSKMIASTTIKGSIAIATGQRGKVYKSVDLAKTADILLEFKGILTSFAIGYVDKNTVGISVRSIKGINAGKLMEKFGGGGNKVEAAAIIEGTTINKVKEQLDKYLK